MLNQYQGQLGAWQQQQQNKAAALEGLGSLVGTLGGAYMMSPGLRKGGIIKNGSPYYGPGLLKRKGYVKGGMIKGPGTGTSDSILASIEGIKPIRLSNGEAVLNKEAIELVGEDFIHRINSGSLAMVKRNRAVDKKSREIGRD